MARIHSETPNQVYGIDGVCWKIFMCLAFIFRTLRELQPRPVSVKTLHEWYIANGICFASNLFESR
jgi:hypothetical protein